MNHSLGLLPLLANAGIPMIFFTFPAMMMLLIPIVIIEGLLCRKWLGLSTWEALKSNAVSNLVSTIVGVPLAWAIMLGVEFGTMGLVARTDANLNWDSPLLKAVLFFLGSAWIGPPQDSNMWIVPAAIVALLVPFFFASYGTEYLVLRFMVGMPEGGPPNLSYPRVRIAARNVNLITYGAMFVATVVWLVALLPRH